MYINMNVEKIEYIGKGEHTKRGHHDIPTPFA